MLASTIVLTALMLGVIGVRADRRGRVRELWLCNGVAAALFLMTVSADAAGRIG